MQPQRAGTAQSRAMMTCWRRTQQLPLGQLQHQLNCTEQPWRLSRTLWWRWWVLRLQPLAVQLRKQAHQQAALMASAASGLVPPCWVGTKLRQVVLAAAD